MSSAKRADTADALHSAAIHLLRRAREADKASGLSPARLSLLSVLVFGGPATISQLADIEQVRAPTMTRLVQALEAGGLAERRAHPSDKRASLINATRKGTRLLQRARQRRLDILTRVLSPLSTAEVEQLAKAAHIIDRALRAD